MTWLEFLCEDNTGIGKINYDICAYSVAIYFTFNLFYLEARTSNTLSKYSTKTFPAIHVYFFNLQKLFIAQRNSHFNFEIAL